MTPIDVTTRNLNIARQLAAVPAIREISLPLPDSLFFIHNIDTWYTRSLRILVQSWLNSSPNASASAHSPHQIPFSVLTLRRPGFNSQNSV